jgi:PQQ-dependent dehydrogenase (methanol/ethanol family)
LGLDRFRRLGLPAVWLGALLAGLAASAAAAALAASYSFAPSDVERGKAVYVQQCAACHGSDRSGAGAPALGGVNFMGRWLGGIRTFGDFDHAIRAMPKQAPGSLPDADYTALMAYLLSANGVLPSAPVKADAYMGFPTGPAPKAKAKAAYGPLPAAPPSVAQAKGAAPAAAELLDQAASNWLMYNRTYKGDRFSPLSQINADNAARLQPVCMLQLGVLGSFQGSPLIYNGTGYVSTVYGVYAFDAATCDRKWSYVYEPAGDEGFRTNRGLAIADGKLFRGTSDGHLIALDAETGQLLWDVHVTDASQGYGVGAAPVVYDGRVIIGLSGGDYGLPGHVYAFDARTGQKLWTFDTIDTTRWKKGAEYGGGASWTTVAVDPKEGLVYIPVGNPAPDYYLGARPGDNLYSNSVVAVNAATGKVAWYVQQIAADYHDWDTAAAPILYEQDGHRYMAVGTKAGYLHIYDRDTHRQLARVTVVPRLNDELPLTDKPLRVCPGTISGVEWNGPAYDPASKSIFVNSIDWCATYKAKEPEGRKPDTMYLEGGIAVDPLEQARGWTRAFDAATGKERWAREAPMPMVGAVTPTAGGVVLTGGGDGRFLALDQRDGKVLYSFNLGGGISGGVATYMVGDRQYIAVASGGAGIMTFGIGGAPTVAVFALPPEPASSKTALR